MDRTEATLAIPQRHRERPVRAVHDEGGAAADVRDRFEAVFRARYGELYSLSYRLLGDHNETENVVQETFLKLDGEPVLGRPVKKVAA